MQLEKGSPARIDAFTYVVNAHGGLLELGLPLRVATDHSRGSGARRLSKIVGMRRSPDSNGYLLSFEFDNPTPNFWPETSPAGQSRKAKRKQRRARSYGHILLAVHGKCHRGRINSAAALEVPKHFAASRVKRDEITFCISGEH